jgi:hypothetical protein
MQCAFVGMGMGRRKFQGDGEVEEREERGEN